MAKLVSAYHALNLDSQQPHRKPGTAMHWQSRDGHIPEAH